MVVSAAVVFASIAAFAAIYSSSNHTSEVLIITKAIPQGALISADDLGQADVAISNGVTPILVADASELAGQRAAAPIPPGSLLVPADLTRAPRIPVGDAVVGLALKNGQLPASGVEAGDQVMVVQTASPGTPLTGAAAFGASGGTDDPMTGILVPQATVFVSEQPPADSSGDTASLVSVEVSATLAPAVSAASTAGQVTLVLLPSYSGGGSDGSSLSPPDGRAP